MQPHTHSMTPWFTNLPISRLGREKHCGIKCLSQGHNEHANTLDWDPDPESNTLPLGTAPMTDVIIHDKLNYLSILVDVENYE